MTSRDLYSASPMTWIDYMDNGFYRASGMLAPGKSYPLACGEGPSYERRRAECSAWNSLLGPTDLAVTLSLGLLWDARGDES